jgi:hypothetical protein
MNRALKTLSKNWLNNGVVTLNSIRIHGKEYIDDEAEAIADIKLQEGDCKIED